jgi:hypothetical protein
MAREAAVGLKDQDEVQHGDGHGRLTDMHDAQVGGAWLPGFHTDEVNDDATAFVLALRRTEAVPHFLPRRLTVAEKREC